MKASELRIGNWVTIDNPEFLTKLKDIPLSVKSIDYNLGTEDINKFPKSDGKIRVIDFYGTTYCQYSEFVKPIPLTEEWLLKFGFSSAYAKSCYQKQLDKTEHYFYVTLLGENILSIGDRYPTKEYITVFTKPLIQHVHQLQNLYFALTGEELTIK